MRLDTGQHMRLDQRMKLAPRMIQSMEILQMPLQALEERIEQELASNPTLEIREPGTDDRASLEAQREQESRDDREAQRELVVSDNGQAENNTDDFERLANISEEYGEAWEANTYESDTFRRPVRDNGERNGKMDALANTAARSASLNDQLLDQWRLVETTPQISRAGEYLIGLIDADGYIRVDDEALMDQAPSDVTREAVTAALTLLQQSLDPPGLAARDLRECLLLQIDAKMARSEISNLKSQISDSEISNLTLERELVANHLKDIEANRLPRIAKSVGRSLDDVKQAILNLRQFHPHPGRLLSDETPRTIQPDAIVEYDEENDVYVAHLTHGRLPPLYINNAYAKLAKNGQADKRTREFVNRNLTSARWLIDAIHQRNATLLRVMTVVLHAQRDFFDQGAQALKPLPMTLVADQLGIHVATVSRAVHEKYLQTPRGIVPLRMFFSGGTETESGDSMSWAAVQATLEKIIEEEDKSSPLSDDKLVEELKKHGIEIARRTVAKYRKQLNILPARQRREY